MLPIAGMLVNAGLDFVTDLIKDKGEDLALETVKKVTGIDLTTKKELTPEEIASIKDSQNKILEYHQKNTADARSMYKEKSETADSIALSISKWNLPLIVILIIINVAATELLNDVKLAIVSNFIGIAIKTLFDERATVINFFFGSSQGSKDKSKQLEELS